MRTHYSYGLAPALLGEWARKMAATMRNRLSRNNIIPVLCFRGMSGTTTATALSLALYAEGMEVGMMYVRKEDEDSHGAGVEVELPDVEADQRVLLIFVDDFVSSGQTFRDVRDKAEAKLMKVTGSHYHARIMPEWYEALTGGRGAFTKPEQQFRVGAIEMGREMRDTINNAREYEAMLDKVEF